MVVEKLREYNNETIVILQTGYSDKIPPLEMIDKMNIQGYLDKLKGEDIPYSARIIAIADTYDAMTSTRSYRKALDHDIAINEISKCAGTQFDPVMAQKFVEIESIIKSAKDYPEEYYLKYSTLYKEIID